MPDALGDSTPPAIGEATPLTREEAERSVLDMLETALGLNARHSDEQTRLVSAELLQKLKRNEPLATPAPTS